MADINLKVAVQDTTFPAGALLFGADSQEATSPSVYPAITFLPVLPLSTICDKTGVESCSTILNDLIASMIAGTTQNRPILIDGRFRTTAPIVIDRSALTADPILGARTQISLIGHGPAHGQIVSDHAGACIDYRGNSGNGIRSLLSWSGFGLYGPDKDAGSIGIKTDNLAYFSLHNLDLNNFERGFDGTDTFLGEFSGSQFSSNTYGMRLRSVDLAGPNAVTFRDVKFKHNGLYGGRFEGGSGMTFIGGSVEGNGDDGTAEDTGSYGLLITGTGGAGRGILSMHGVYFEGNKGFADLWLDSFSAISTYSLTGCTFNRTSSTNYTLAQVVMNVGGSGVGSICHIAGCGFGAFGTYTDSGSRPNISGAVNTFADGGGNTFSALYPTDVFAPSSAGYKTVANLPDAAAMPGAIVSVTNGDAGSPCLALSDGSTWRRIVLGATVATS